MACFLIKRKKAGLLFIFELEFHHVDELGLAGNIMKWSVTIERRMQTIGGTEDVWPLGKY